MGRKKRIYIGRIIVGLLGLTLIAKADSENAAKVTDVTNGSEYLPPASNDSSFFVGVISDYKSVQSQTYDIPEQKEISELQWLLNLYNPHLLGNVTGISPSCGEKMNIYLNSLEQNTPWAAKMSDASGRYSSQFFFGNNFWLGSESLCTELSNPNLNEQTPPFPVSFRVATLVVKLSEKLTPQGRFILLGLCLPKACTQDDTIKILKSRTDDTAKTPTSFTVLKVRPVPGDYSLLKDSKFHALGGFILVVVFFLALGTSYEYYLIYRKKHRGADSDMKETGSDIENNNSDKKSSFEFKGKGNVYEVTKKEIPEVGGKNYDEKMCNKNETSKKKENPTGLVSELLLSFSVLSNGPKILNCSSGSEDSLTSVHGLRFFSLAWVILVHTYLQLFAIGGNKTIRAVTERTFMYQTIGNATFSVDSFFFISGLLVSYLYFKNESNGKTKDRPENFKTMSLQFLTLIVYRFIRLTPVYIVVLGMIQLSMSFLNNISVFEPTILDHLNCQNYWWRNILYVNNLFPRKEMCMLWSWYMATDTQFFVLSALLLLLARRHFKFSAMTALVVLVSSWCTTAFISFTNQYKARVQEPFALFDELYDKPWTRIGPYIVGMCSGWLLYQTKCKIKMSVPVVVLGWLSCFACLLSLVYGLGNGLGVAPSSVYVSLGHTAWGLCLAWIVVACRSGYGGWVNSLLSTKGLYPLSRLTYCAYLVHPLIMVLTSYVMDGPFHIHNGLIVIIYLGNVVASFLLAFLLSLGFEAPIVRLMKIIMSPRRRRT